MALACLIGQVRPDSDGYCPNGWLEINSITQYDAAIYLTPGVIAWHVAR